MDVYSLTPNYFEWAVKGMADLAIRRAKQPKPQLAALGWAALFKSPPGPKESKGRKKKMLGSLDPP
jgi:hypothetical protein